MTYTPPGCVRAILPRRVWWSAASDDLASTIPRPQPNWDGLGWVGPQSEEKQPTSAHHMWELLQDCWKSIPDEAGWENAKSAKLSSRQRVTTLKNLKYKIYFDLTLFLITTWVSLFFYNVKNKEKPLSRCVQTFHWYCIHYRSMVWGHLEMSLFSMKTYMKLVAKWIGNIVKTLTRL